MQICYIERVIVGVANLDRSRELWRCAGFALDSRDSNCATFASGAIQIDLRAPESEASGPLAVAIKNTVSRGGGVVGWVWGAREVDTKAARLDLESAPAFVVAKPLGGVFHAASESDSPFETRRGQLLARCGLNPNTVDYLDHFVVMAPILEDAITEYEALGVPCKRIREAGRGIRQAFFKLEQTVIEIAAPSRGASGCWGLAFMCRDIRTAVAQAREHGLDATEPKTAVQGGQIARIVEPLDGVSVALMQAPPTR